MNISRHEALDRIKTAGHRLMPSVQELYEDLDRPTPDGNRRLTLLALMQAAEERPNPIWSRLQQEVEDGASLSHLEDLLPDQGVPRWLLAWCRMVASHTDAESMGVQAESWPFGDRWDTAESDE